MPVTLQNPEPSSSPRRSSSFTLLIAAVAILAVLGSCWFLFWPSSPHALPVAGTTSPKMSPAEEEYAKRIEIRNIALSRAENFLHQEVTMVSGEVHNGGSRLVSSLRLTTEFSDELNQVVLRETRAVLGTPELALSPGERRSFEISFEHVPATWNLQQPAVRVAYLELPGP